MICVILIAHIQSGNNLYSQHLNLFIPFLLYSIYMFKSLATRRGRGFLMTAAFGFLLDGPINTIDFNVQEVVRAITCMYEQVWHLHNRNIAQT